MTTRRTADFDIEQALEDPGFTPRVRDVKTLLDCVAQGGARAELAERALLRVGPSVGAAAIERARTAEPAERARLTRLVGRATTLSGGEDLARFLFERLDDADERTRRAAATALGKARPEGAEAALVGALDREAAVSVRSAMVEALGKVGGEEALSALDRLEPSVASSRAGSKAKLIVARTLARAKPGSLEASREPRAPTPVTLRCRRGLENLLVAELPKDLKGKITDGPGGLRVDATLEGPMESLFEARTMLSFGFPLPELDAGDEDICGPVADAITQPDVISFLHHFTEGPVRYRIELAGGGKRRSTVWKIATEVAQRCRAEERMINDPTDSLWEVVLHEGDGKLRIELCPKLSDPRFTYRRGDVAGASHPTIAAALAQIGGVRPDDVVWDPFVGSGTELCERAIAGPFSLLIGSDAAPTVLPVARQNLTAAGVRPQQMALLRGDATTLAPPGRPTLIITNPPLGRRLQRTTDLAPMLDRFLENAAVRLAPHGRLVWISPFPSRSEVVARRSGLDLSLSQDVDMGGFTARLQAFRRGPSHARHLG